LRPARYVPAATVPQQPTPGFFATHPMGRLLLSGLLVYTLAGVLLWNMPASELRSAALPFVRPWVMALGIDQRWTLFSPNPRGLSILVEARLRFADGSVEVVHPPLGGPLLGQYRGYRWKKWSERIRRDSSEALWPGAARHYAAAYRDDPRGLVEVTLVRRWSKTPPPASGEARRWRKHAFYTLPVPPSESPDG
jgi:hypothetical protein